MLGNKQISEKCFCILGSICCSYRCQKSIQKLNSAAQQFQSCGLQRVWAAAPPRCLSLAISTTCAWNTSDVKHLLTFMSCERSGWMGEHYIQCQSAWPKPQKRKDHSQSGEAAAGVSEPPPRTSGSLRGSPLIITSHYLLYSGQLCETAIFPQRLTSSTPA